MHGCSRCAPRAICKTVRWLDRRNPALDAWRLHLSVPRNARDPWDDGWPNLLINGVVPARARKAYMDHVIGLQEWQELDALAWGSETDMQAARTRLAEIYARAAPSKADEQSDTGAAS